MHGWTWLSNVDAKDQKFLCLESRYYSEAFAVFCWLLPLQNEKLVDMLKGISIVEVSHLQPSSGFRMLVASQFSLR